MNRMRAPRKRFGLQVICKNLATLQLDVYTPRNINVAYAMIESHAAAHGRGWLYKIEDWTAGSTWEPIWLENI